jgi:hypothetical protein
MSKTLTQPDSNPILRFSQRLCQLFGTVAPIVEQCYSHFGTSYSANVTATLALSIGGA